MPLRMKGATAGWDSTGGKETRVLPRMKGAIAGGNRCAAGRPAC